MIKLNSIFICLFVMMMGCQTIIQSLDQMSEADFNRVEREIYLITKISCRQIFEVKSELKVQISSVINSMGSDLATQIEEGLFLDKLVSGINDPDIRELAELILLEVGKYGGFKYLDQASKLLNSRSAQLLNQVAQAIIDASNE